MCPTEALYQLSSSAVLQLWLCTPYVSALTMFQLRLAILYCSYIGRFLIPSAVYEFATL